MDEQETLSLEVVTARLPASLVQKLDAFASTRQQSRESLLEQALSVWVEREDLHDRLTLEALADVDAGRLIEHETLRRWVASLGTDAPVPPPQA